MPKQQANLDGMFHALADPTRRAVLTRLRRGPGSMSELAQPFAMALPSFAQHLAVMEASGLVRSHKQGRARIYQLVPKRLQVAENWLRAQREQWEARLDQLDRFLHDQGESQ